MSDSAIFLITISALFWFGFLVQSGWYWLGLIAFGIMLEWPRTIPMAWHGWPDGTHRMSEADQWWVLACNVLMVILVMQLWDLRETWRERKEKLRQ